jgi:hypothetical protein
MHARLGLMALVRARARARRMRIGSDDCSASAVRGFRNLDRNLDNYGLRMILAAGRLCSPGGY